MSALNQPNLGSGSTPRLALRSLLLIVASLFSVTAHAQQALTGNLLVNPGAELGSIANWTPGGPGTPTVDTGTFDGGINPHTGSYDFLGHDGTTSSLSQTVSLTNLGLTAATLDSGTVNAAISFWEQGLSQGSPSDDASITLTFLDGSNAVLGTVTTNELDSHDGTWQNLTASYPLPAGTRSVTYTMNFIRHAGSDLDAFVDDNSLILASNTASGLTLSPTALTFRNQTVGTTSAPQVVTVTNPGATTINLADILLQIGPNPSDFAQTNNCPAALVQNTSCQISVTFAPQGVGAKSSAIEIDDDSTVSTQYVTVAGTGTGGILQVDPGDLKTIAGTGTPGYSGDGGPATSAQLNQPEGVVFDSSGNLYITDVAVVRKVTPTGVISTFAGTGVAGYTGDGGPATSAQLRSPASVAFDAAGNAYIADTTANVVRKVTPSGTITTFAGTGTPGRLGDGGPATSARLNQPQGARFDRNGNLFVPQCGGPSVRKITPAGIISTVAGTFSAGFSGDGGPAVNAQLACPSGVAIDSAGNFYIADYFNQRIRKVDTSGTITTVAGNGTGGFSGDGGPATAAEINLPNDVALDAAGNLYIADSGNNRVRKIAPNGIITTVAGGLANAGSAGVNTPLALNTDSAGNLFFSDTGNSAVRELFPAGSSPFPATAVGAPAVAKTFTLRNIGNLPVTIAGTQSFSLSGNSADFTLSGGSCLDGTTLSTTGNTCTLQVAFAPLAAGVRTLTVSVADTAVNSPQSFNVSGTGTPGTPTLTWPVPAPIVFGTPLGATQLDAVATGLGTAPVAGTYAYTPPAGTILSAGPHTLSVAFASTDPNFLNASATVPLTVTQATPTLTWPTPAPISYGTPLGAAQLNAAATGVTGAPVAGTFTYTPAAGTILSVGTQTLRVVFTPTDPNYSPASASVSLTVAQATPTLTWPTPAPIPYGTALGGAQLNASVTSGTSPVAGTFTYTPPAGTILSPGTQTLRVAFTPTDTSSFASVTGSVSLTVTGLSLTAISPSAVRLGAAATTLTLTGSGFVPSSVVQLNGAPLATTYVNPTTLSAIVPAASFTKAGTLAITVADPSINAVSAPQTLTVIPATPSVTVTGPAVTAPGSQPSVSLAISNPYPLDLTATFALSFASASTPSVDDPAIQFAAGGRTFSLLVPANSTVVPPIQLQAGTVAGTITIPVVLTAAGSNVTPTGLGPVVIVVPPTAPVISTVTLTRNAQTLSVAIHGFSNTREVTTATFHFVAAPGASVSTPDLTAPVTTPFTTWFASPQSPAYGSTFTYTQVFNLSDDSKNIGSVQVTLTNSVGTSALQSAQ